MTDKTEQLKQLMADRILDVGWRHGYDDTVLSTGRRRLSW